MGKDRTEIQLEQDSKIEVLDSIKVELIIDIVCTFFEKSRKTVFETDHSHENAWIKFRLIYFLRRYCILNQRELSSIVYNHPSSNAVHHALQRVKEQKEINPLYVRELQLLDELICSELKKLKSE